MVRFARLLIVALIAVLALWSVAQAAGATAMSLEMATAVPGDAMDMPGCNDCDPDEMGGEAGLVCHSVCLSPALADMAAPSAIGFALVASRATGPVQVPVGLTYSPDPYPPRSALLI